MPFIRRSSGSNVNVSLVRRRSGGTWVTPTVRRRQGGAWVVVPFVLTLSTSGNPGGNVFLAEPAPASTTVNGGSFTVNVSGGSGSYTRSWTRISGSTAMSISNSTAATVTFSGTVRKNDSITATWRCTVTDTVTGATSFVDLFVQLHYSTNL